MSNLETKNTPLTGQVAIVTGGGRSIGRSIAQILAGAGMQVVVAALLLTSLMKRSLLFSSRAVRPTPLSWM